MNEADEIHKTIQELRKAKYSELPENLITEIISIEAESIEDRANANRRIERAIESYLDIAEEG